jgi:tripartite-type tricarboxylate transporter receptor subunit TctC
MRFQSAGLAFRVLVAFMACTGSYAHGQTLPAGDYPNRPIRVLIGSSAGGGVDAITRAVMLRLSETWRRSIVVDNRTGAGGVIALELLAQAAPDGYTLYGGGSQVTTATPLKKIAFDTRKAFAPIAQMTSQSYLLLINPATPVNSVKDLIAYARSRPGTLSYGSAGVGAATHLGTELFKSMAGGLDLVHVPYKGNGPAFIALMGGEIHMMFTGGIGGAPHLKSGKLKAIAVTSLRRMQAFPELPTISESGVPGYELDNMYGLYAPAGVAPAVLLALNREVGRIVNSPEIKDKLAADGSEAAPANSPAEFKARFAKEVEKWERFIARSKIKLE